MDLTKFSFVRARSSALKKKLFILKSNGIMFMFEKMSKLCFISSILRAIKNTPLAKENFKELKTLVLFEVI